MENTIKRWEIVARSLGDWFSVQPVGASREELNLWAHSCYSLPEARLLAWHLNRPAPPASPG